MIEKIKNNVDYKEFKKLEELFAWANFYINLPNWNKDKQKQVDRCQTQIEEKRKYLFKN